MLHLPPLLGVVIAKMAHEEAKKRFCCRGCGTWTSNKTACCKSPLCIPCLRTRATPVLGGHQIDCPCCPYSYTV